MHDSPIFQPRWSVVDYQAGVLMHRVPLPAALRRVYSVLAAVCAREDGPRYWPLFTLSRGPLEGAGDARELAGGLVRSSGLQDAWILQRGVIVDVRDAIAEDPRLDIGGAATCIYHPFRNIDLCELAYRDMPLLFDWPADRVNHLDALDPALERHLRERHAAALAAGEPVHLVLDRARLTHLDELHMWVLRQIFYFHACPLGQYTEPDEVYGFSDSPFGPRVVLAFGCAPHAHEMAWGIAFDLDDALATERVEAPPDVDLELALTPRFVAQVEALLGAPAP